MDGLAVKTISEDAWSILQACGFGAVSISDASAKKALQYLDRSFVPAPVKRIGETGIAGLAAIIEVAKSDEARRIFEMDRESHCLAIATEGISDPTMLSQILLEAIP